MLIGAESYGIADEQALQDHARLLLEPLRHRYCRTRPVLAVTDAARICRHVGATLLVVRQGRYPLAEILESANRLRNGGVTPKGVLFTDAPQRRVDYGTYSPGYYGYGSSLE